MNLKDYFNFKIASKDYKDIKNLYKINSINPKLLKKYMKMSPVFCILEKWFFSNFGGSSWANMKHEWIEIKKILLLNISIEPLSLEVDNLYILKALLILVRTFDGYKHSFVHHVKGFILQFIYNIIWINKKSVALINLVQNFSAMGWAYFFVIYTALDIFSYLHHI